MSTTKIADGLLEFHELPQDMHEMLSNNKLIREKRNSLTDIQRNEWICRVTIVKKEETRQQHLERLAQELSDPQGNKTPCCWPGCPHRRPQAAKYFETKK